MTTLDETKATAEDRMRLAIASRTNEVLRKDPKLVHYRDHLLLAMNIKDLQKRVSKCRAIETAVARNPKLKDRREALLNCHSASGVGDRVHFIVNGPRKPGRPKQREGEGETRGLYLSDDLWEALCAEAEAGSISRSALAERILRGHAQLRARLRQTKTAG